MNLWVYVYPLPLPPKGSPPKNLRPHLKKSEVAPGVLSIVLSACFPYVCAMLFICTLNSKLELLRTKKAYWTHIQDHDNDDKVNIPYVRYYKVQHFRKRKIAGPRGASRGAPGEPAQDHRGALKN